MSEFWNKENIFNSFSSNKQIRFICVGKIGNPIIENNQSNVKIQISDKQSCSLFITSVLDTLLQKDFDDEIGILKYGFRIKIDMTAIRIYDDYLILIFISSDNNCDQIAISAINFFQQFLTINTK